MSNLFEKIAVEIDETVPYSLLENIILDIEGLSANKKIFLIMLRRYAGHENKPAFPSYRKLMLTCGIKSDDTITKNIRFFEWLRFLEKVNRNKDNGEKDTNYYMLSLKNMRLVLGYFEENKIKFQDVEKYFDVEYKKDKTFYIKKPCKFFGVA